MGHISDYALIRYHLGMVTGEAELATLRSTCWVCPGVRFARAEEAADYVDARRGGSITGTSNWSEVGRDRRASASSRRE